MSWHVGGSLPISRACFCATDPQKRLNIQLQITIRIITEGPNQSREHRNNDLQRGPHPAMLLVLPGHPWARPLMGLLEKVLRFALL